MKNHLLVVLLLSIWTALSNTATAQTIVPGTALENSGPGKIDWTVGEVYATGIGAPPAMAVNAAQSRAMTERAAYVVALRNLLETVKGVRVDSETLVENFMVKSDVIRTRVDGIVKGARIVKKEYMSDGSVEMLVAMSLKGEFMNVLVPENFGKPSLGQIPQKITPTQQKPVDLKPTPAQPQSVKPTVPPSAPEKPVEPPRSAVPSAPEKKAEPAKPSQPPAATTLDKKIELPKQPEPGKPGTPSQEAPTVAFKGGKATGLVIDGRGLGLKPALLPKIVDTQGQEIYVAQVVTRTNAVEQGVAGYAKDVNAAANNFRVTDNPAVIKGLRSSGSGRSDIVVGQADAQILRQLSSKGDFLQYCRVIIVY